MKQLGWTLFYGILTLLNFMKISNGYYTLHKETYRRKPRDAILENINGCSVKTVTKTVYVPSVSASKPSYTGSTCTRTVTDVVTYTTIAPTFTRTITKLVTAVVTPTLAATEKTCFHPPTKITSNVVPGSTSSNMATAVPASITDVGILPTTPIGRSSLSRTTESASDAVNMLQSTAIDNTRIAPTTSDINKVMLQSTAIDSTGIAPTISDTNKVMLQSTAIDSTGIAPTISDTNKVMLQSTAIDSTGIASTISDINKVIVKSTAIDSTATVPTIPDTVNILIKNTVTDSLFAQATASLTATQITGQTTGICSIVTPQPTVTNTVTTTVKQTVTVTVRNRSNLATGGHGYALTRIVAGKGYQDELSPNSKSLAEETGCHYEMDLVLVLDCSHSVTIDGWQQMKQSAKAIINAVDVTPQGTHISIIVYSSDVENFFMFDKNANKDDLNKLIDGLSFYGGWSRLDIALNAVLHYVLVPVAGSRKSVPKVVVVFSDGNIDGATNSADDVPDWNHIISKPLNELRSQNVTILAVACGLKTNNFRELNVIGGSRANVYNMTDINLMIGTLMRTSSWKCPERPQLCTITPPSCKTSTTCLSQLSTCIPVIPPTKCTLTTTTCSGVPHSDYAQSTSATILQTRPSPSATLTIGFNNSSAIPAVSGQGIDVLSIQTTIVNQPINNVHTIAVHPIIVDQIKPTVSGKLMNASMNIPLPTSKLRAPTQLSLTIQSIKTEHSSTQRMSGISSRAPETMNEPHKTVHTIGAEQSITQPMKEMNSIFHPTIKAATVAQNLENKPMGGENSLNHPIDARPSKTIIIAGHTIDKPMGSESANQPLGVEPFKTIKINEQVSSAHPINTKIAMVDTKPKVVTVTEIRYIILSGASTKNILQSTPIINNLQSTPLATTFTETLIKSMVNQTLITVGMVSKQTSLETVSVANGSSIVPFLKDKSVLNRLASDTEKPKTEIKKNSWFNRLIPEFVKKWMAIEP